MKAYSVTLRHAFKSSILTHHVVTHHHMVVLARFIYVHALLQFEASYHAPLVWPSSSCVGFFKSCTPPSSKSISSHLWKIIDMRVLKEALWFFSLIMGNLKNQNFYLEAPSHSFIFRGKIPTSQNSTLEFCQNLVLPRATPHAATC